VWALNNDTALGGKTMAVFRTNNLKLTMANAQGAEICIALLAKGPCPTLASFCDQGTSFGCQYAMFNTQNDCCSESWALSSSGVFSRRRAL
jgi:hypothetical protein